MGVEWSARTRHQESKLPLRGAACVIEPDEVDRDGVSSLLRHMGFATHDTASGAVGALIADQIHLFCSRHQRDAARCSGP